MEALAANRTASPMAAAASSSNSKHPAILMILLIVHRVLKTSNTSCLPRVPSNYSQTVRKMSKNTN